MVATCMPRGCLQDPPTGGRPRPVVRCPLHPGRALQRVDVEPRCTADADRGALTSVIARSSGFAGHAWLTQQRLVTGLDTSGQSPVRVVVEVLPVASALVFTVRGSEATPAESVTLADAGLRERDDLLEWVLRHPQILGRGVMIITFEFDQWWSGSGSRERDRLDVLGLGDDGRLVVAELKRDLAPDTVEMQAIKYAAMACRFTEDALVDQLARFRMRQGLTADEGTVRELLATHVGGELDSELLTKPRIVLVAGAFAPVVTASAVWLTEMGLDLTLQRVQAYRTLGGEIVVTVSQLFPVPDVEEFMVSPQRASARADEAGRRRVREGSTVVKLVDSAVIPDGTTLQLRPVDVDPDLAQQVEEWVNADPRRGRAAGPPRSSRQSCRRPQESSVRCVPRVVDPARRPFTDSCRGVGDVARWLFG